MATNVRALRLAVVMTLSSAALTACGEKIAVATKPPAELLTCADEPVAPDLPPYAWDWILAAPSVDDAVERMKAIAGKRDALTLDYILTFRSAWGSCKSNRSEEHTSELQSLMRISYAVFCLKKKR